MHLNGSMDSMINPRERHEGEDFWSLADEIEMILNKIPYVTKTVVCKPGDGAKVIDNHLF